MKKAFFKRIGAMIPTLIGASILAFALVRMVEGDPVMLLLGERGGSPEVYAELEAKLGLDQPLWKQYFSFVTRAATGDMGVSIVSRRPVLDEFFARFPATLELGFAGLFWAILLGIPLGIIAAVKRGSFLDYSLMGTALVGYSMPIFWWGLILILFFSIGLGWTPVSGRLSVFFDVPQVTGFMLIDTLLSEDGFEAFKDALLHLLLPAIALGTIPLAVIARMTRASMLEVLGEDYMRTAKAKGASAWSQVMGHALRNALIPIITVIGLMVGIILTGAVLTESIFSWPGVGLWLVNSVTARDYPVIQGGILYIAFLIMLVNLTVDMLYIWANPKMRGEA